MAIEMRNRVSLPEKTVHTFHIADGRRQAADETDDSQFQFITQHVSLAFRGQLMAHIASFVNNGDIKRRLGVLIHLFHAQSSENLDSQLSRPSRPYRAAYPSVGYDNSAIKLYEQPVPESELERFLRHPLLGEVANGILSTQAVPNRYLLGALLANLPTHMLNKSLTERLGITSLNESATIKLHFPRYWLCKESEERMQLAMQTDQVILVNNSLLVKKRTESTGKQTGICIANASTPKAVSTTSDGNPVITEGGTFLKGGWYSPIGETATTLWYALDSGKKRINLRQSTWAHMRDATLTLSQSSNYYSDFMGKVEAYKSTITQ